MTSRCGCRRSCSRCAALALFAWWMRDRGMGRRRRRLRCSAVSRFQIYLRRRSADVRAARAPRRRRGRRRRAVAGRRRTAGTPGRSPASCWSRCSTTCPDVAPRGRPVRCWPASGSDRSAWRWRAAAVGRSGRVWAARLGCVVPRRRRRVHHASVDPDDHARRGRRRHARTRAVHRRRKSLAVVLAAVVGGGRASAVASAAGSRSWLTCRCLPIRDGRRRSGWSTPFFIDRTVDRRRVGAAPRLVAFAALDAAVPTVDARSVMRGRRRRRCWSCMSGRQRSAAATGYDLTVERIGAVASPSDVIAVRPRCVQPARPTGASSVAGRAGRCDPATSTSRTPWLPRCAARRRSGRIWLSHATARAGIPRLPDGLRQSVEPWTDGVTDDPSASSVTGDLSSLEHPFDPPRRPGIIGPVADTLGNTIVIRGAREHNLRNVDLELPRDQLIVFTGLSGSGKSSLAFDTIYAEGQRRYVESLSAYARQFLGQMDKPDVDFIEGLSPAISIDQKSASRNPRSTVGTITEIYDYLRLLYARIGIPHCPNCGRVITRQTPQQIVDRVLQLAGGHALPGARAGRAGPQGRVRGPARTSSPRRASPGPGSTASWSSSARPPASGSPATRTTRSRSSSTGSCAAPGIERRLTDSLETALRLAEGVAEVEIVPARRRARPTSRRSCSRSTSRARTAALSFDELAPRNFSFNSPYGACERCDGLGTRFEVDPELLVPDDDLSHRTTARSRRGRGSAASTSSGCSTSVADEYGFSTDTPWKKLKKKRQEGRPLRHRQDQVKVRYRNRYGRQRSYTHAVRGRRAVARAPPHRGRERPRARADRGLHARGAVPRVRWRAPAAGVARGHDRRPEHLRGRRAVDPQGRRSSSATLELSERDRMIAERVLEGGQRAAAVPARRRPRLPEPQPVVGARWPAARRSASGWRRRSAAGSSACSTCSTSRRSACTSATTSGSSTRMVRLRDLGNTVIVVEHDEETIRVADHVVDIGPGAGEHGGEIVVAGTLEDAARRASGRSPGSTSRASDRSTIPEMRRSAGRRVDHGARRATSTTSSTSTSSSRSAASSRSPA